MRLVLDTSVVVSAVRSEAGVSRALLRGALMRRFDLIVSVPLILEYESVLTRPVHLETSSLSIFDVHLLLERLSEIADRVDLGHYRRPTVRDPDDEHVLNLAWRSRADLLVTRNLRDFEKGASALGVNCCLPAEAARLLEL
jgi:putative PIN family toxin of toxin-antitoxin system